MQITARHPGHRNFRHKRFHLGGLRDDVISLNLSSHSFTILIASASAIYTLRLRPVYEGTSRVEIDPNKPPNVGLQSLIDQQGDTHDTTALQTQILIMQSDSVLFQTAEKLHLVDRLRGAIMGVQGSAPDKGSANNEITPSERLTMINMIKGGLKVSIVPGTQVLLIRYRNTDPKLSADVVNELVDTYIDVDLRSRFDRTMHVSQWLQSQLEGLKREASDAQRRLAAYQMQQNIVITNDAANLTIANLSQINSEYENAEIDKITKEARMREFEGKDPDIAALMGDNPQVAALRSQLSSLNIQRAQLATTLGARHPRIEELDTQIIRIQSAIEDEVSLARRQIVDEYNGASQLEQSLRKRLDAQKQDAYKLNQDEAQYAILKHEAELNRDLYDALQMRLKEASVTAGLAATNINIVDRAYAPTYPVAPRKTVNVTVGLFGGLLIGVVLAFVMESIDDTVQTSEEVEKSSLLPSLATIPHIVAEFETRKGRKRISEGGTAEPRDVPILRDNKSTAAEAFRALRSSILLASVDKPPQVVLVTSAFPGEGKTTTAINLAVALAQLGERVLLVDGDLRRGRLASALNLEVNSVGMSMVLSHPEETVEFAKPFAEVPRLEVLPTGPRPPNPAEMLSSQRMAQQVRNWRLEYDRIVFDSSPLLAVSDTQAVATLADSVVLVARAGFTRKRALIRVRDLLLRIDAPISGVVVNDIDMRLENFYTSRYGMYGTGYRYGYDYSHKAYGYEDQRDAE